jgi:hypothetical protein
VCEWTDLRSRRVAFRTLLQGTAIRSPDVDWVIVADLDGQRVTVGFPPGEEPKMLSQIPGCPSGMGNLGTGD